METRIFRCLTLILSACASGVLQLQAFAAPGDLDVSFGNEGKVTTAIGATDDWGYSAAVQKDGKIVVAGVSRSANGSTDIAVVRYNANGTLDATFGNEGKVVTSTSDSWDGCRSVVIQDDGKILVAGYTRGETDDIVLVRYHADGTLNIGFGVGGVVKTAIGGPDYGHSVALQRDGRILVAGYSSFGSESRFALARYLGQGGLDTSFFSGAGKAMFPIGNGDDVAYSVVVQDDGKILVAGDSETDSGNAFALVRFMGNGDLDTNFGDWGKVTTSIGDKSYGRSVAMQSDGKIVMAGYSSRDSQSLFALARYNTDGSLDTSFGSAGKVTTSIGDNCYGHSVAIQDGGKILVAGYSVSGSDRVFALVRYNVDGSQDMSFGDQGKATTAISSNSYGHSVAIQGDGKIVVAGYATNINGTADFALARYVSSFKPTVTTGPVISITATSAHLSGSVNPNGAEASVIFETAKTGELYEVSGNAPTHQSPLRGSDTQSVSGTRTGLLPHTTYKFRVSATSSAGTSVGENVTFTTANSQPVANEKTIHPNEIGSTQTIFSPVTDASDADGDPLSVTVLSYSGTGSVQVIDGVVRYTGGLLDGTETVTVEVSDGFGGSDQATITLSNAAPVVAADSVSASYGRAVAIPVLANDTDADGDTLGVVSLTQPSHGRVIRGGTDSNVLVYIPQLGFSGVDTFTYTMSDGRSAVVTGTVEITVGARPNPSSSVALDTEAPVPGAGEPESGIPSGATWRIFGVPAINDAAQVAVLGTWRSPEGSGSGIFVDEQLVVKTGDPVPGLASVTFKSFTDPVLNGAGRVAFLATITGPGVRKNNDTMLVTNAFSGELELVAREGDIAAEAGEAKFGKFYSISLLGDSPENAGLLFTASLLKGSGSPKVKPTNDLGAWLRTSSPGAALRKVVREGDPGFAGGEKIKSFQLLQALRGSAGQGRGQYKADEVSFTVTLTSKRQALVRFRGGVLEEEALTGELLGEALPEAKWKSFGMAAADGTGMVSAVRATLQGGVGAVTRANASGIFVSVGTGGAYAPVVRVGDEPFGVPGGVFSALSDPLVSGWNPGVAFLGSIKGQGVRGDNNTGIWWQTLSGSTLVARAGMQAIEAPEGARWKSFSSLALPDGERGPVFVATLARGAGAVNASNDTGLWAMDSVGEVRLLARERDPVGEKTLKSFSTLQAVSGSAGVRRSFNNGGQVVYRAYFTDGSQGVVKVQVP